MKRGEADKIGRQPKIGTINVDSLGRRWKKVRRLTRDEWRHALVDAAFDARFGLVGDSQLQRLGFELTEDEGP